MTASRLLTTVAFGAALALAPVGMTAVVAQESAPETPQPPAEEGQMVSEPMIESFALAAIEVATIQEAYGARFEAAEDDAEREAIATEAQGEMVLAVEETDGITVQQYLMISEAAQLDADLNERIMTKLREIAPTVE